MLENTIGELHEEAGKYAYQAEDEEKLESMKVLLAKSNSFRKSAKEKETKSEEYTVRLKLVSKRKENVV